MDPLIHCDPGEADWTFILFDPHTLESETVCDAQKSFYSFVCLFIINPEQK